MPRAVANAEAQMSAGYSRGDFSSHRKWISDDFRFKDMRGLSLSKDKYLSSTVHFQAVTRARSSIKPLSWKVMKKFGGKLSLVETIRYAESRAGLKGMVTFTSPYRHEWRRTSAGWRLTKVVYATRDFSAGKFVPYPNPKGDRS
jgi:hypothetical protein